MSDLINAINDLDEPLALNLLLKRLEQKKPVFEILEECRNGMIAVGDRYAKGEYFLGDLVLSAEIFQELVSHLTPLLDKKENEHSGKVVFGTVEGDIHDIGKNITISLMQCYGFKVYDLGVNTPSASYVKILKETGAEVLCLSILLTSCIEELKHTIQIVREDEDLQKIKILIGGSVNEMICNYVRADGWTNDARQGVIICQKWLAEKFS